MEDISTSLAQSSAEMMTEKPITFGVIETQIRFLQGKILTIADASFSDERQCKAVKDLIKKTFSDQLNWLQEIYFPSYPAGYDVGSQTVAGK